MADWEEDLPEWNEVGTEPPQAKKDDGWAITEKPPAGWLNWLFNRIYACIAEIRTTIGGLAAATHGNEAHNPAMATAAELAAALHETTGHDHSGAAGEGPNVPWANVSGKPSLEPTVAAGEITQYYRGDKSWQTLIGESSTTAHRGDHGKTAYDHSQVTGTPHVSAAEKTAWNSKEPGITASDITKYWRGDKSWQTLNAAAVGLGNVVNQAQLPLTGGTMTGNLLMNAVLNVNQANGRVVLPVGTDKYAVSG